MMQTRRRSILYQYLGEDIHQLHHSNIPGTARDGVGFWKKNERSLS